MWADVTGSHLQRPATIRPWWLWQWFCVFVPHRRRAACFDAFIWAPFKSKLVLFLVPCRRHQPQCDKDECCIVQGIWTRCVQNRNSAIWTVRVALLTDWSQECLLSSGVQSFVCQFDIQRYKDQDIQNYNFACCLVWVWNLVYLVEGGT